MQKEKDSMIHNSLLPELSFARELWQIHPEWKTWKSLYGKRIVELSHSASISLKDALIESSLATSKSDATRLIQQGGVSLWFIKETNPNFLIHKSAQEAENICLVQKGKHGNHLTADTAIIYWKPIRKLTEKNML